MHISFTRRYTSPKKAFKMEKERNGKREGVLLGEGGVSVLERWKDIRISKIIFYHHI
jgi:hypothetical protein